MRIPITFRGGRLPHDPARPTIKLGDVLDSKLAPPPESADCVSDVPPYAWGMLGNDTVGDCTCAGVAHKRIGDVWSNQGTILEITTAEVLAFYENFGYRPDDPSTDQGAYCQKVLETWRQKGFLGRKLVAFARINLKSPTELKQAVALFGQVYFGLDVPESAMAQFNDGEPWTVVPDSPIEGSHCVTIGAYDKDGVTVVTWGRLQKASWEFIKKYGREGYVGWDEDDIDPKTGKSRAGLDAAALAAQFSALTRRHLFGSEV